MRYCPAIKQKIYELKFGTLITCILFAYFSIFLTPRLSEAGAVSSISGSISDGATITIKGSGFGSSGPNVVVFDDFESGNPGANIKTGPGSAKFGQWNSRAGSSYYGTKASVSGTKAFSSSFANSYGNAIEAVTPANTKEVFVSWWLYLPSSSNWPGETSSTGINWKQMWILGHDTVNDDFTFPTKMASSWGISGNDDVSKAVTTWLSTGMVKGKWKRMWGSVKGSTNSSSYDGSIHFYTLDSAGVTTRVSKTGLYTLKTGGAFTRVKPNAYGRQTSNCESSFDDIYIATGPNAKARVEIGNASTYTASTKLTILTPTSWKDGSISAIVNSGQFKTGEAAYLFVFKADGSVSSGYPIKIGTTASGDSSSTPISPPAVFDFRLSLN